MDGRALGCHAQIASLDPSTRGRIRGPGPRSLHAAIPFPSSPPCTRTRSASGKLACTRQFRLLCKSVGGWEQGAGLARLDPGPLQGHCRQPRSLAHPRAHTPHPHHLVRAGSEDSLCWASTPSPSSMLSIGWPRHSRQSRHGTHGSERRQGCPCTFLAWPSLKNLGSANAQWVCHPILCCVERARCTVQGHCWPGCNPQHLALADCSAGDARALPGKPGQSNSTPLTCVAR